MLELMGRYAVVKTKLKDMHDQSYYQISLQFVDVKGERQNPMMTLKNVQASMMLGTMRKMKIRIDHI